MLAPQVTDAMRTPAAVEIAGLHVDFADGGGTFAALADVSLSIPRHGFVSLIGSSGCGKTTLLRAMADLVQPRSGSIEIDGQTPHEARLAHAYGFVFQSATLMPWRDCHANVSLPMEVMGWPKARRQQEADRALEVVGLSHVAHRYPWQLSGGMQQRVSIARALTFGARILLMDEPFGALDEITREALNVHLRDLWARTGITVVFVTHSIAEAVFLSTEIVVMAARPGRIIDIIASEMPAKRDLSMRHDAAFVSTEARVRAALERGSLHV